VGWEIAALQRPFVLSSEKLEKYQICVFVSEGLAAFNNQKRVLFLSRMYRRSCCAKHEKLQWVAIDWPSVLYTAFSSYITWAP